jgi:hypothetical protein
MPQTHAGFRIDADRWREFVDRCANDGTTASEELKRYIDLFLTGEVPNLPSIEERLRVVEERLDELAAKTPDERSILLGKAQTEGLGDSQFRDLLKVHFRRLKSAKNDPNVLRSLCLEKGLPQFNYLAMKGQEKRWWRVL